MAKINRQLLSSNWMITLTATLVGVLLALFLNEWMASRHLRHQRASALDNISYEMAANLDKLSISIEKHEEMQPLMDFLGKYQNEEGDLQAHKDTMQALQQRVPGKIIISDSTYIGNDIYDYNGSLDLQFSMIHLEMSTVAWSSFQSSNLGSSIDFECLMYLESVYKTTEEVLKHNSSFLDYFWGERDPGEENEHALMHLQFLVSFEQSLLTILEDAPERLMSCN